MNLKFNPEAQVTEWANGPLYRKNEGEPFAVNPRDAKRMLKQMHEVRPRQFVPIFIIAPEEEVAALKVNKITDLAAEYPNDFPHMETLIAAGYSFDAVQALGKAELVKVKGIGPAKADEILSKFGEASPLTNQGE